MSGDIYYTLDRYMKDGFEIKSGYTDGRLHYLVVQRGRDVRLLSYNPDSKVDGATGLDGYMYPEIEAVELSS